MSNEGRRGEEEKGARGVGKERDEDEEREEDKEY